MCSLRQTSLATIRPLPFFRLHHAELFRRAVELRFAVPEDHTVKKDVSAFDGPVGELLAQPFGRVPHVVAVVSCLQPLTCRPPIPAPASSIPSSPHPARSSS